MAEFQVGEVTKPRQSPEVWLAGVTIVEDETEHSFHVLIPDSAPAEPTADWIEAQLRAKVSDDSESAVDQLADCLTRYYGVSHPVIQLQPG